LASNASLPPLLSLTDQIAFEVLLLNWPFLLLLRG
jgi:hypothetical protein